MFLALDECKSDRHVLGLLAIPLEHVPVFERDFCSLRLSTKTMGEIKWSCVSQSYVKKYLQFVDLFLNNPHATFHAITYTNGRKYHAAYSLIRVLCWKLSQAGIRSDRELFILFDGDTEAFQNKKQEHQSEKGEFANAYDAIKTISKRDGGFTHRISFCHQGASHQFGILQIADILTGATSAVINERTELSSEHRMLIEHIRNAVGHDFDASRAQVRMPALHDFKIHFLDPVRRELERTVHSTGIEPAPF